MTCEAPKTEELTAKRCLAVNSLLGTGACFILNLTGKWPAGLN